MHLRAQLRSLLLQSILWIAIPIGLVLFAAILAGTFAYQRVVVSLLLDRDRQLAALSGERVARTLDGYALLLETLAQTALPAAGLTNPVPPLSLEVPEDVLSLFSAGIVLTDRSGFVLASAPSDEHGFGPDVSNEHFFIAVRQSRRPVFSDITRPDSAGGDLVVVGVPIFDALYRLQGTLLAGIYLEDNPLGDSILGLNVSDEEFAFLVDGSGRVIFHPDPGMLGRDLKQRPFVRRVMAGESGGMIWTSPEGTRLVQGYAPVVGTGWGLVVREPWETVVAPVRAYGIGLALASATVLLLSGWLLILGVQRIAKPIRELADQARNVAQEEEITPLPQTGIREIDALSQAFSQMAEQVSSYRAGLRRYLGAITRFQEEERLKIARDLHDETTQSLLAMLRHLELLQTIKDQRRRRAALQQLQKMLEQAILGLRQIGRDLRPFLLEDLGLLPALRALLRSSFELEDPSFEADFEVSGRPYPLSREHDLALYRIAQEALANIRRHAAATQATLTLCFEPGAVTLRIRDDGQGFVVPPSLSVLPQRGSYGLMGMQERVWSVGGELTIESAVGTGTELSARIPLS